MTGERVERGDRGDRGVQGERGERGDHGQHGEKGDTGSTGSTGSTGASGPIGRTGPTSPYLGRNQTLVIFAFIVVAFVLLAYRTELNTDRLDRNVYEACVERSEIKTEPSDCEGLR